MGNGGNVMSKPGKYATEIRDDDVCFFGQRGAGRVILNPDYSILVAVGDRRLARDFNHIVGLDGVNATRAHLTCQQRKQTWTTTEIDNDRIRLHRASQGSDVR